MPFKYHPPTRQSCEVCRSITGAQVPVINSLRGKASAAGNFPIHNWYNFVLGYTPEFPDYVLKREKASDQFFVVDPFMGSGTTQACCKALQIPSGGVDANDYFHFVASTKLNWQVECKHFDAALGSVEKRARAKFTRLTKKSALLRSYIARRRPILLKEKYISSLPLAKLYTIREAIESYDWPTPEVRDVFRLAFSSVVLPASNVRYGPGFGVIPARKDVDVFGLFREKIQRMKSDLEATSPATRKTRSLALLGDARNLERHFKTNSIDLMITSPPYPGDHEYTKHSRLELLLTDLAKTQDDFRVIKKRMLRGSTTNIYKEDNEGRDVRSIEGLSLVCDEIAKRLKRDGGTSGFEKLYVKLVWEYFGGMYRVFQSALKTLKPGGKFALLVSDSHAFKMVHIKTADLLAETALLAGFKKADTELWQYKTSTSHKYKLLENILTVTK